MAKIALLIGMSDYQPGFDPLPGTQTDIREMQRVLQHPQMGGFDQVDVLPNPNKSEMELAIEKLLADRQRDDLVLLYFSGHGFKDDDGSLYFVTRTTEQRSTHQIYQSTAVPASAVQGWMSRSRCKRQVLVLDCCFSGAFAEGMKAKAVSETVDINAQFGGEGRAVLTSSTALQYSFEQQEASIYTRYLVEGIESGAADTDSNGVITINELHDYAKRKVQEAAPAMKPEIFAVKEGYTIVLAKAPQGDPKLEYRKDVEQFAQRWNGKLSNLALLALQEKRRTLKLSPDETETIQLEVLRPYQEFEEKLRRYEQFLAEAIQNEFPLSTATRADLQYCQQVLGLRDEDVAAIEARARSAQEAVKPEQEAVEPAFTLERFDYLFNDSPLTSVVPLPEADMDPDDSAVGQSVPVPPESFTLERFDYFFNDSPLTSVVPPSEADMSAESLYESELDTYNTGDFQRAMIEASQQELPLNEETCEDLKYFQKILGPEDQNTAPIETHFVPKIPISQLPTAPTHTFVRTKIPFSTSGSFKPASSLQSPTADPVAAHRNNKPLIWGGVAAAGVAVAGVLAISMYLAKLHAPYSQPSVSPAPHPQPSVSPSDSLTTPTNQITAEGFFKRARDNYKKGDKQAAIQDYNQILKLQPNNASAYCNRGHAQRDLGNQQAAIKDYNQAIKLKNDYVDAYIGRGNARQDLGDQQVAIEDYNQAIKLYPNYALAYNNRGNARSALGDKQAAIEDYNQAIRLYPDYALAYYNRGIARSTLDDKQAAIQDYQKAATLYQQQGNTEWYQKALDQIKALQK